MCLWEPYDVGVMSIYMLPFCYISAENSLLFCFCVLLGKKDAVKVVKHLQICSQSSQKSSKYVVKNSQMLYVMHFGQKSVTSNHWFDVTVFA